MPLNEKVYLLLVERSSELLLPFLDRYEIDKLARGRFIFLNLFQYIVSTVWFSNVASYKLFSTIVKSIKGVVEEEAKTALGKEESKKMIKASQIVDPNKQYTSTRMLPTKILRKNIKEVAVHKEENKKIKEVEEE
jgi:hypothetical protein